MKTLVELEPRLEAMLATLAEGGFISNGSRALALLEQIAEDTRVIRRIVEAPQVADLNLLQAIARAVDEGEVFTANDLIAIAEVDPDLAAGVRPVAGKGRWAGVKLGRRLEDLQHRQVGPYRIQRGPQTREGVAWSFARVMQSPSSPD